MKLDEIHLDACKIHDSTTVSVANDGKFQYIFSDSVNHDGVKTINMGFKSFKGKL
jgi:hypothetical protein